MADTRRLRRRRKKHSPLFVPLSFIVICAAVIFGLSVFFRVSQIEVDGATQYSENEVVAASGVEVGDNLFFLNRSTVASRLYAKLPYVTQARVSRVFPNKVIITISESVKLAYVHMGGDLWAIDQNCRLLEKVDPSAAAGLIEVTGITPLAPKNGDPLSAGQANASAVSYLAEVLDSIQTQNMQADVTRVDMTNPANPTFDYLGRFTVKLGADGNTSYKFQELLEVIAQLKPTDAGSIDLSADKEVHFSPN